MALPGIPQISQNEYVNILTQLCKEMNLNVEIVSQDDVVNLLYALKLALAGGGGTSTESNVIGLPVPKVTLRAKDWTNYPTSIECFDPTNNYGSQEILLHSSPQILSHDLTNEQILKGVFLEMVVFKKIRKTNYAMVQGENDIIRTKTGNKVKKGFIIPPSWEDDGNGFINNKIDFIGKSSRNGAHTYYDVSLNVHSNLNVQRINHVKIQNPNERINLKNYLHNRLTTVNLKFRDINGFIQNGINVFVDAALQKKRGANFNDNFNYGSAMRPFMFAFRYISIIGNNFTSGPLSETFKIVNKEPPLIFQNVPVYNGNTFITNKRGKINPKYTGAMVCKFA